MMKNIFLIVLMIGLFVSCGERNTAVTKPDIIPVPHKIEMKDGKFKLNGKTDIYYKSGDEEAKNLASLLSGRLSGLTGKDHEVEPISGDPSRNSIYLALDKSLTYELGEEGYLLTVLPEGIRVISAAPAGLFYGIQTIYQLLPPEVFGPDKKKQEKSATLEIPCMEIKDKPSFSWRGMHLDVSRHFFPKEFIKKYIDLIAMHKMNVFHWHLTDDNGWRIQIDKYPALTEVSAWRADRSGIPWNEREPQRPGEPATYGGFYSKDDIREIVAYAKERYITVIPEIEMPGHTSEVFAAYPALSCTGEKMTVQTGSYWPNSHIFCAGNEDVFTFLEDVLDEVIELFPAEYVHIGGDEADKTAWKTCSACQARIRKENLEDVEELQSYFVKRIEKYINGKGKRMIGWDEILQGGLAPDATVMSWQGFEGGIAAAEQGHDVVMCPTSHCYFDYYQADPAFQPPAIGGLTTLKKVYSFRPVPSELKGESRDRILGGQGNIWTEYISTPEHAEYMALPRMTALAEVLWSNEKDLKWGDFRKRLRKQFLRFRAMDVKYFEGSGKVEPATYFDKENKSHFIRLHTELSGTEIYYTLNGNVPTDNSFIYKDPIPFDRKVDLKAVAFKDGRQLEQVASYILDYHEALGKEPGYNEMYSERYPASGSLALTDGLRGSLDYNDGFWQGFNGNNADFVIDFGQDFKFQSASITFLMDQKKWIFIPKVVNFYFSMDGINFQKMAGIDHSIPLDGNTALTNDFSVRLKKPMKIRFLRVQAENIGVCPDWHPGKGQKAWIFTDEIVIK